jgi:hypothetical protein
MSYEHVVIARDGDITTITMNRPGRRNALSLDHMLELTDAFRSAGASDCTGVVLAGAGKVFSSGHDFADMVGQDLPFMRRLLSVCAESRACTASRPLLVANSCAPLISLSRRPRPASPSLVGREGGSATRRSSPSRDPWVGSERWRWRSPAT